MPIFSRSSNKRASFSERLDGRTAVVCGGAGEVGEGIVAALLEVGARVAVPSRTPDRLHELQVRLEERGIDITRLTPVIGDLSEGEDEAKALADEIANLAGPPDLVIAALGGWDSGPPLADLPLEDWEENIGNSLRAHQLAVNAFVPLLRGRKGAGYVMINGAAGRYPVPGSGVVSVAAAGELMMAQVLAAEEAGHGIQIEAYVLGPVATRSRADAAVWMASSHAVGQVIATRASHRFGAGKNPTAATVIEILTAGDLAVARKLPPGGVKGASVGPIGWVMWGLQTGAISNQIRRSAPPPVG